MKDFSNMEGLPHVIYLMGSPGAGKGTQASLLAKRIGYHQFSTGDAFRAIARKTDTELGRRVKDTIDNGFLCPPELAAEVVISAIQEYVQSGQGLIFDGTPRTVKEAEIIDEYFEKQGWGRPLVVYLHVDKEVMMERNSKRTYCLDIDNDFLVTTKEDVKKCEEIGGRIGIRPDDEPEKFETRWAEFQSQTMPVVQKYREEGILHELDGMRSIEDVHQDVAGIVDAVSQRA